MVERIALRWPQGDGPVLVLDEFQQQVVEHSGGHLRVLAGPGTGKTSVIVAAVHERLRRGDPPESMLVLTYGRMAAQELRSRLEAAGRPCPPTSTFHALARRLMQDLHPGVRLMGAPEQETVLRGIVRSTRHLPAELEQARGSRGLAEQVRAFIAEAQAAGLSPADAPGAGEEQWAWRVYGEYLDVIGFAGAVDYAELIRRATSLVREHPPEAVRRLRTVFVDEYQDTDPAQVRFLQALAAGGAHVVAVGDPDQAIYGFRGADVSGLLRFEEDFPQVRCTTVALGATRRFGPDIAAVARRVVPGSALPGIDVAAVRTHRAPAAHGPAGTAALRVYESESAQAEHIADLLRRAHAGTSEVFPGLALQWSQMAVLVRSGHRDMPALQRALVGAGIPVEIARDDIPLAHNAAVRPLVDVLRAAADADGGLTPERARDLLCSELCGLDARKVARLGRLLRQQQRELGTGSIESSGVLLAACLEDPGPLAGLDPELAEPATQLAGMLDRARGHVAAGSPPSRILDEVWRATRWPQRLRGDALGGGRRSREANLALDAVMELFDLAAGLDEAYEGVHSVADLLQLLDEQAIPAAPDRQRAWSRDAVRLLTAHRSKGSQWPLVVVAGAQEGTWPDLRARPSLLGDPLGGDGAGQWRARALLEERRLFFVACTRASRALLVSAVRGSADDGPVPSPFLALAAGDLPVVEVPGRPRRPLTPAGVVAGLRQELMDPQATQVMRAAAWQRLQGLADRKDWRGRPMFPWANPHRWWGRRTWTVNDAAWYPADRPLPVSASSLEQYLACPRRWFLERRVEARDTDSTRSAFGNILHLCARAVAHGELPADEDAVDRAVDEVWAAVGYEPGWQSRFERDQARAATRRLLRWMQHAPGDPVGAELEFEAEVVLPSGESVAVRGTADRVDRVGDQLVITDYKTGRPVTAQEAARHVQMGLYRWAAELGALGEPGRAVAQLLFLRQDAPRGQSAPGAKLMVQDAPDVPEWLAPVLDAAVSGIRAQLVVARPGPGCRTCPVASSCPADPMGAEVRP
jgi:superfamily I DNA/RNA helicase/RecB family exonuclease